MIDFLKRFSATMLIILMLVSVNNCSQDEGSVTSEPEGFSEETVTKMNSVSSSFIPTSMATSSVSASIQGSADGSFSSESGSEDPCEGTDLFGCQPRLVKLYLSLTKEMFDGSIDMLEELSDGLGQIEDGASGVELVDNKTLHYSKTSSTIWSLLFEGDSGVFVDIAANDGVYTIKLDMAKMPPEDNVDGDQVQLEIEVDYTSDTIWGVQLTMIDPECNPDDPQAPQKIRILMDRNAAIYTGKAMLYSPRWAYFSEGEPTCASAADDARGMNLYTDFVANNTAAKVKVHMMKRTVSDVSNLDPYAMNNMCNSYFGEVGAADAAACVTAFLGEGWDLTSYPNPFCTTGPNDVDWGTNCVGTADNIAIHEYGSADDWMPPSTFYQYNITFRSSLN